MPFVTLDVIRKSSDRDLNRAIWRSVLNQLEQIGSPDDSPWRRLARPWRAFYTCRTLDGEVVNGGFHQFFWNSEGELNTALEEDLLHVGANGHLPVFQQARRLFDECRIADIKRAGENTWEEFTAGYKTIPWGALDERYWALTPKLPAMLSAFVRSNEGLYL